jgi:hypothetical protein
MSAAALVIVIVGASACGEDAAPSSASTTPAPSNTAATTADPEPDMTNPVPRTSIVDGAVADLADRLSVEPQAVSVVSAEEVTWPDGSLGCPEPGRSYTQALVDGTLIRLAVDGVEYQYHAGRSGDAFYCPADRATPPTDGAAPDT